MTTPEKRRRTITELVAKHDGLTVEEIAEQVSVSESTVRRDLRELAKHNRVERTHGGALPVTNVGSEPTFDNKVVQRHEEKRAIGSRAVEEIQSGQIVFFDSGTTTLQIAQEAPNDGSFVSVTNSPVLALELGKDDGIVKVTGGAFREESMGLVGPTAERYLRSSNFDLAFLGTNGITTDGKLSAPLEDGASLKREVIENSAQTIVVADASKFGQERFREFTTLADVDAVVSERLPREFESVFEEATTEWLEATED